MKKRPSTGILILFILFCLIYAQIAFASSATVGVSNDGTLAYNSSYHWSTTNPNQPVPQEAVESNQTVEIQITVTSISGSIINTTKTYRYQNGTEQFVTGYADAASGDNEEVGAFFFVSSNLSVGDRVYPSGLYGDTINQTLQREYAGSQREVLLDSSTYSFEYNTTVDDIQATRVLNSQIDYYFDKQTGVCLEQREQTTVTDPNTNYSETTISLIELKQTNLWGAPAFPTITVTVIFAFVIALIIAVLAVVLRRRKT